MSETAKTNLDDHIAVAIADSAVMAALLALQVHKTSDTDEALDGLKKWIDVALEGIVNDPKTPDSLKAKISHRVTGIFDISKRMKTK